MQHRMIAGSLAALLALLPFDGARAATETLPDLRDLDVSSWDCLHRPEGSDPEPGHRQRNRMKNRDWIDVDPADVKQMEYTSFVQMADGYDGELRITSRTNITEKQAARLAEMEDQIVSLTGWVVLCYPGPKESCNCDSAEFHDWHVELLPASLDHYPGIGDPTPVICESTPRVEGALYRAGIRLRDLAAYIRLGEAPELREEATGSKPHRVRITGYVFWDDGHCRPGADTGPTIRAVDTRGYVRPWRATAWEIHPILRIDVLDDAPAEVPPDRAPSRISHEP